MNVYFVNVLLACIIAYGAGYWYGKRQAENRISLLLSRMVSAKVHMVAPNATDDVTKH